MFTQFQDDLRKERHKGAKLETKLAKLELGKVGALKGYQKPNNRPFTQAEYEAMKDKLVSFKFHF